ncbi:hypothetical protein KGM_202611 [Danaus plexippus plexippus]|uniref:Non-structural maintenance of chromosomes element 1 homolog n=1 Tax=Danaus plexippus plexippus TaxID=278856 RepID=A0A212EWM9_DANPL|nr:hypothetical protein KGM_202611 [Danaus plexippus plexippus]
MLYGNSHRFLLRSIASQGVVTFEDGMKLFKSLPELSTSSLENVIEDINKSIRPFEQTIKIVIDELTLERKLVFLCLGYDDTTKLQNMFAPNKLDYFRILMEEIVTTENREITEIQALNLVSKVKPTLHKTDAKALLKTWYRMHYLDLNITNYALGIRAIHEFERYLKDNLPDYVQNCTICKQMVFRGINCPACDETIHTRCLNVCLDKVRKWPCCRAEYSETHLSRLNNSRLTQTQLLQSQTQGNTSAEQMDVSEILKDTQELNISARSRKRKRIPSD